MNDAANYLYQFSGFYAAVGFLTGLVLLNVRGRGILAWARHPAMLLAVPGTAAVIGYLVAKISPDYGTRVVIQATLAAWAWSWAFFGLIALWRNNVVAGSVLDRYFVLGLGAVSVALGFVYYMVRGVEHPAANWAYAAVPSLSGALYRLFLVVAYLRVPLNEREELGTRLERGIRGFRIRRPAVREEAEVKEEVETEIANPPMRPVFLPAADRLAPRMPSTARKR